tara:strand:+ start:542893 stop:544815 length:1923 start_codon:yes stop_codon:yes gene_type:complete
MTSIAQSNVIAKIAAVVAGLSLVAMSFAYAAPAAKADTTSDLQAQISALLAQIAALQAQIGGGSASAGTAVQFNMDLTIGSKGADVTSLQQWLVSKGMLQMPAGVAYGYFGALTKAAVASYQASVGISPAVGYFGPITRAKVNAAAGSTGSTGGSTGTVGLAGNGRLTDVGSLGDVTSDLDEGDSATSVVGVSAYATNGDVQLQRLDVTFTIDNNGGSSNLNKYIESAAVYLDGKKLASMSASDGDKDGRVWTMRFSSLNGVIKSGNTGEIYVKVTPVSSIGSDEDGDNVQADLKVDSLRAIGSEGISETYISTQINGDFSVSTITDGTLTVSLGSDNPKASQIAVSSSTTTGVTLLTFSMKAKNQDITVEDLVASFGTSDNNLNDVISNVKLMKGSKVLKSKTVSTGTYGTVTFDNLDLMIDKDATEDYSIVADLKGNAAYADGTTLIASTTTAGWDVSDADGASVTPSASALGNSMVLTATGISVTKGTFTTSTAAGLTGAGDIATFTMPFTVTAGDEAVFIAGAVQKGSGNVSSKIVFGTTTTSTSGATGEPVANLQVGDTVTGDSAGAYYKVNANTSRTFTLNVAITATTTGATTAGYVGTILNSIAYGATSGAMTNYFTSNLDTFKTNDVYVTKR